jgi:hypothetical protein
MAFRPTRCLTRQAKRIFEQKSGLCFVCQDEAQQEADVAQWQRARDQVPRKRKRQVKLQARPKASKAPKVAPSPAPTAQQPAQQTLQLELELERTKLQKIQAVDSLMHKLLG